MRNEYRESRNRQIVREWETLTILKRFGDCVEVLGVDEVEEREAEQFVSLVSPFRSQPGSYCIIHK